MFRVAVIAALASASPAFADEAWTHTASCQDVLTLVQRSPRIVPGSEDADRVEALGEALRAATETPGRESAEVSRLVTMFCAFAPDTPFAVVLDGLEVNRR